MRRLGVLVVVLLCIAPMSLALSQGPNNGNDQDDDSQNNDNRFDGPITKTLVQEQKKVGKSSRADSERRMVSVEKAKLKAISKEFSKPIVKKDKDSPEVIIKTGSAKLLLPEVIEGGSEVHTFYTNRGKKHASLDVGVDKKVQEKKSQLSHAVLSLDVAFQYDSQLLDVYYYGADGILKKTVYNVKPEDASARVDVTSALKNNDVEGFKVELYSPEGEARVTVGAVALVTTFEDDEGFAPKPRQFVVKPPPNRPSADHTKPDDDDEDTEEGADGDGVDSGGGVTRAPPALTSESSSGVEAEVTAEETSASPLRGDNIVEETPILEEQASPFTGAAIADLAKKNWPGAIVAGLVLLLFARNIYKTIKRRRV